MRWRRASQAETSGGPNKRMTVVKDEQTSFALSSIIHGPAIQATDGQKIIKVRVYIKESKLFDLACNKGGKHPRGGHNGMP